MYQALYRKYRPSDFENVVGQKIIIKTLSNSVLNNKISHAYLFTGPRGTGKTSIAKILAKIVNCENLEDLNLGYVSDNSARILVRNVKTFREVNEVKLCLRDLGYSDVLDIDVKGNDVILVVTKDNLKIAGIKFTEYDAFKNTINDFVYIFNDLLIKSKQKSQIINESKDTLINTVDNEQKIIDNSNEQSISNTNNK